MIGHVNTSRKLAFNYKVPALWDTSCIHIKQRSTTITWYKGSLVIIFPQPGKCVRQTIITHMMMHYRYHGEETTESACIRCGLISTDDKQHCHAHNLHTCSILSVISLDQSVSLWNREETGWIPAWDNCFTKIAKPLKRAKEGTQTFMDYGMWETFGEVSNYVSIVHPYVINEHTYARTAMTV